MRGNCRMSRERKRQEFFHLGSHTRMNEGPTSRQLARAGNFFFQENYSIKITSFFCKKFSRKSSLVTFFQDAASVIFQTLVIKNHENLQ